MGISDVGSHEHRTRILTVLGAHGDLAARLLLPGPGGLVAASLEGGKPLSVRDDMSVESWRIVEFALDAWHDGRVPLEECRAGSAGPAAWKEGKTPMSGDRLERAPGKVTRPG